MMYGLIFWGNSYYSNTIFRLQVRTIRIIVGIRDRESCREIKNTRIKIRIYIITFTFCDQ
jgi:hypothetical protein